ncbi:MAG: DUF2997 domain-containing protein [Patescibacteria group bacterium]|nr:DUF2997 domain-containing protein [Patescibacteria group bacterium]
MCEQCHVVLVECDLRDIDALDMAANAIGGTLHVGQRTWRWVGAWYDDYHEKDAAYKQGLPPEQYGHGEHAISFPRRLTSDGFEVGICKVKGQLKPVFDFCDGGLTRTLGGQTCPRLIQAYAAAVTRKQCAKLGYSITESPGEGGSLELTCTSYADGHKLIIAIDGAGVVKVHADGFQGSACSLATTPFVQALGLPAGEEALPEMYVAPPEIKEEVRQ